MLRPLRQLYDAVPDPKIVVAIGACAVGGGPWFDTYNVVGGVDRVIPVDLYVPGCPARPETILHGVAQVLELARKRIQPTRESQVSAEELARVGRGPARHAADGRGETHHEAPALSSPPGPSGRENDRGDA
jgi:NADH:ubiquinone oxidoreductase subunit B-like Fe-S oxidoreductase